ncbi:MAG: hypothetical protein A2V67_05770 [Deltaproteobacteria bacterium RBG_13_61_14]|nr:MAG: hypothetical protein A2V67_05770 [Deltaproteobacteria bacterium RBG_13_61_14]
MIRKVISQALTPIILLAASSGTSLPDRIRWKKDGALLVKVPAGEFRLGSNTGPEASRPERKVFLETFYLDRTEVSNGQYFRFCQAVGRPLPVHLRQGTLAPGQEDLPVNHVTWEDADAYCRWAGRRLPREAEWEKAARGLNGRTYPWGNGWDPGRSRNRTNANESPAPAGSYPKGQSPYGALDLAGNVWEWTADWYRAYPGGPLAFDETGKRRVARGGAFFYSIELLKSYVRYPLDPQDATEQGGFRCAVSIPAQ